MRSHTLFRLSTTVRQLRNRPQTQRADDEAFPGINQRLRQVAVDLERPRLRLADLSQRPRDRRALKDHGGRRAPGQAQGQQPSHERLGQSGSHR